MAMRSNGLTQRQTETDRENPVLCRHASNKNLDGGVTENDVALQSGACNARERDEQTCFTLNVSPAFDVFRFSFWFDIVAFDRVCVCVCFTSYGFACCAFRCVHFASCMRAHSAECCCYSYVSATVCVWYVVCVLVYQHHTLRSRSVWLEIVLFAAVLPVLFFSPSQRVAIPTHSLIHWQNFEFSFVFLFTSLLLRLLYFHFSVYFLRTDLETQTHSHRHHHHHHHHHLIGDSVCARISRFD